MMTSPANPPNPRFFALIPCAGQGSRAGSPVAKQYQPVDGLPLVAHTLRAFRGLGARGTTLAGTCVVVSADDQQFAAAVPDFNRPGEQLCALGGQTRALTVRNGLQALLDHGGAHPGDWALVHDAARCLVTPAQIQALIDACRDDAVGGLLAQPLPDTLKGGRDGRVTATIDRSDKWLAQTPQMFRIGALIAALDSAGDAVTDEASAMEAQGLSPKLVKGSAQNFKVTYPEDFALAAAVLASRRQHPLSTAPTEPFPEHIAR